MNEPKPGSLQRGLEYIAAWVQRGALLVLLGALVVTGLAMNYTAKHLSINTSTLDMIDREVPFRRNDIAFRNAFPEYVDPIVAMVETKTPEAAEEAAARLETSLATTADHVARVTRPGSGPYFERTGMLFLDLPEITALADRLASAQPLLAQLARDPTLRGIASVLGLVVAHPGSTGGDAIAGLLDRMAAVTRAGGNTGSQRLSWQSLFSPETPNRNGLFERFLLIQPKFDRDAFKPTAPAMDEIRRMAAGAGITPEEGLRLRLTGPAALDHEELESVEIGGRSAAFLSLTLVSLLLVVGLRSWVLVLGAVTTLIVGLLWTAGFAAIAIGHLNLISVAFAVLFVGLGIDFGIHLCLRYREEAARMDDRRRAIRVATVSVGAALFLSAISAAAGFYAFLPTAYKGLAELGLIAGTGMFIALTLSLTLLPAILTLLPFGVARWRAKALVARRLTPTTGRRGGLVLWGALILALAAGATLPFLRFDFNPVNLSDPAMESVSTFLELAANPEGGVYTADILAPDLPASREIAARLEALPAVGRVVTVESFVPEKQAEKLRVIDDMAVFLAPVLFGPPGKPALDDGSLEKAYTDLRQSASVLAAGDGATADAAAKLVRALDDLAGNRVPGNAALQRLDLALTSNLPVALDGLRSALDARAVALDNLPPELARLWVTEDGRVRIEASPADAISTNAEMERFADAVLAVAPTATGVPIVVSRAGRAVVAAFRTASLIAFAAIVAILLLVLRRPRDMVLVLAPLALAAVLTGATAVLLGLSLNFANVIVLPLLLGLGVSSGIHLVMRGREERDEAVLMASSTPRAVLFSSLTTVASFGSLALSGHLGMTSMGLLLTIAIGWTLIATLIVLPALMDRLGGASD